MIETVVWKLVDQMETKRIIEAANREYYEYALITMSEHIIAVGTMLVISTLFKNSCQRLFFWYFSFAEKTNRRVSCR